MIKKHICIYTNLVVTVSKQRRYYVDYEEIDAIKKEFVFDKTLKTFRSIEKARKYAERKAKELGLLYSECTVG